MNFSLKIYSQVKVHFICQYFVLGTCVNADSIFFISQGWLCRLFKITTIRHIFLSFLLSIRGGSLPARGWSAAAGGVGGKQACADLPGWRQLASAVPLDSQQQQHH